MNNKIQDFWGDDENDLIVDKATPIVVKMLAMSQELMEIGGDATDRGLSDALNAMDVEQRLMDMVVAMRTYEKEREKEIESEAAHD